MLLLLRLLLSPDRGLSAHGLAVAWLAAVVALAAARWRLQSQQVALVWRPTRKVGWLLRVLLALLLLLLLVWGVGGCCEGIGLIAGVCVVG